MPFQELKITLLLYSYPTCNPLLGVKEALYSFQTEFFKKQMYNTLNCELQYGLPYILVLTPTLSRRLPCIDAY